MALTNRIAALLLLLLPAQALAQVQMPLVLGAGGAKQFTNGVVTVDSSGAEVTNPATHTLNITCVTGCGGSGSVTITGSLPSGTNVIGGITNTAFGVSGSLPAYASTPTFNVGAPAALTSTSTAGAVTTALTFQTALSSSSTRKGCLIQNTSADTEYIYLGATGSATVGASIQLMPSASFVCANLSGGVATDNLAITSATINGATFTGISQ